MAQDIYLQMQKLANQTQIKLQEMSNNTTAKTFNYNTKEAKKQRDFSSEEAEKARDWQKMMSDTSHRREVKDLKKAGLNPVLSVNQGAASYTTSSAQGSAASGEAENPSSAVSQIMSSQLSGMAGVKESEIHAAATRHAAAVTAAAQRAAASQAAAATKYAADMAYRTQIAKNEADYKRTVYQTDHSKSGTIAGILDNAIKNAAGNKAQISDFKNKQLQVSAIANNSKNFLLNKDKGLSYFNLNWKGKQALQSFLRKYDIKVNMPNQMLVFNALVLKNEYSARTLGKIVADQLKKQNRAAQRFSNYRGFI